MNLSVTIFLKIIADRTFAFPQKKMDAREKLTKLTAYLFRLYSI